MSPPATTPGATAPLNRLRFGADHPGGSIDARKTRTEEGLPELLASILAQGLIYPLIGRWGGKDANRKFYVAEGNRRLAAMRLGVIQKRLEKNHAVRIEELPEDADALELSLTANVMRLPMHEVDQYEAFVALRDGGSAPADIASRFGTSELVVRRRLALGSLSPKLRDAWRAGKVKAEAAEAFTVSRDHTLQETVYASLAQGGMLFRHSIIRALTKSDGAHANALRFVGAEAYVAAGGRIEEDLFRDESHVLDPEILVRLERAKIEEAVAGLLAAGWAWAALEIETPHDRYRWSRIKPEARYTEAEEFRRVELHAVIERDPKTPGFDVRAMEEANDEYCRIEESAVVRAFTAEDRAASGCMLKVDGDGALDVEYGVIRPPADLGGLRPAEAETGAAPAAGAERDDGEASPPPAAEISGALAQTVSEWLTVAAANALADEPELALRVLLAALQSHGAPARFSRNGWSGLRDGMKDKPPARHLSFAEELAETLRCSGPHLRAALAAEVARSLDLTVAAALHPAMAVKGGLPMVDALDPESFLAEARRAFDPAVYFDRAPAAVALAAVAEMGGPKPAGNKGRVALAASELAEKLGWLPPGMRSGAYIPPRVQPQADTADRAEGRSRGRRAAPTGAPLSA